MLCFPSPCVTLSPAPALSSPHSPPLSPGIRVAAIRNIASSSHQHPPSCHLTFRPHTIRCCHVAEAGAGLPHGDNQEFNLISSIVSREVKQERDGKWRFSFKVRCYSCLIISKLSILVGCHKTEINELGELESEVGLI